MVFKRLFLILIYIIISNSIFAQITMPVLQGYRAIPNLRSSQNTEFDFYTLSKLIRASKIEKHEALLQLNAILKKARQDFYLKKKENNLRLENWIFPVQNQNFKTIGGRNGSGYIISKFDFFDYSKPGGHPAHDIFIKDKNQDCIDDVTLQRVGVLSVSAGIVLSVETCWTTDSIWKGGKFVYIFDPTQESIFYYAHNDTILVSAGDIVLPGTLIAFVGRTGVNAYAKRSQTHLHFSQLKLERDGFPHPRNPYQDLIKAKTLYTDEF